VIATNQTAENVGYARGRNSKAIATAAAISAIGASAGHIVSKVHTVSPIARVTPTDSAREIGLSHD
jgi:hypothetical protein